MCLGIPGRIVAIVDAEQRLGVVDIAGVRRQVDLTCVASEEDPGLTTLLDRWVLLHVGFALGLIDTEEAHRTLALLAAVGEMDEELEAIARGDPPWADPSPTPGERAAPGSDNTP
ncbi:MAG: HypC/HybG/HupF family hydrogenase formation chaperone [Candidatus Competibacterales bacterium]